MVTSSFCFISRVLILIFIVYCTGCIGDYFEYKFAFEKSNGIIGDGFDVIVECSNSDIL